MKWYLLTLLVLSNVLSFFTANSWADPIDSDVIFQSAQTQSVKFSPNARYVMGAYLKDSKQELVLRDTAKGVSHQVLKFTDDVSSALKRFEWIDNNSLSVRYTLKGKRKKAFVHMKFANNALELSLKGYTNKGYIVDNLPLQDDVVLYTRNEGEDEVSYQLYTITTQQLSEGRFSEAKKFENPLENAIMYFSDRSNDRLVGVTRDGDDVYFWWRGNDQNHWVKFGKTDTLTHDFKAVGQIDDDTLAVLSNETTDTIALVEFNLTTQKYGAVLFQHKIYDLVGAQLTKGNKSIASVSYYDHGRLVTRYFDEEDKRVEQIIKKSFPDKQFIIVDQKVGYDGKLLFVYASNDAGSYYHYDNKTGQMSLLGKIINELDQSNLSKSEVFTVNPDENTRIEGILTNPVKGANGVLLVMPHGGPIGVQEFDVFDQEVQFLASRGYAVLRVNFRGSSGYGKKFEASGVGQLGKAIEDDITAAVDFAVKKYQYKQRCAIGTSYGGYSAMMLAMRYPDDYQCVISMYGVYDLPFIFNSSNVELTEEWQDAWTKVLGENNDELATVSPFYMAEKLKAPLLLIAGKEDQVAWFEQSNRMKYRLKQLGKSFEYVFYKGVGHGHNKYYGDRHQFGYIDHFIRQSLALPFPGGKDYQTILGKEYVKRADVLNFGRWVKKDRKKALAMYRKAAEQGHQRATYNIGTYYQRGEIVNENLTIAAKWYQQASDLGYQKASYQLAKVYRKGIDGEPDHQRAVKLFQLAQTQGNELAILQVAKAHCLGRGVPQSMDDCVSSLLIAKKRTKKNEPYNTLKKSILASLFWHKDLSHENKQKLTPATLAVTSSTTAAVETSVLQWGAFSWKNSRYPQAKHDTTTDIIELQNHFAFGAVIELNKDKTKSGNSRVVFKVRWTTPFVEEGKVIHQNNTIESLQAFYINEDNAWFVYVLDEDWEKVAATWRLEVYTLDDKKVFEKVFYTKS